MAIRSAKALWESSPICPAQAEGPRAVDGGHAQNLLRRNRFVRIGQRAHFGEHVQFRLLSAGFAHGGEAVGAEAEIDAGIGQSPRVKGRMPEIIVAARAMDDVGVGFAEQAGRRRARGN